MLEASTVEEIVEELNLAQLGGIIGGVVTGTVVGNYITGLLRKKDKKLAKAATLIGIAADVALGILELALASFAGEEFKDFMVGMAYGTIAAGILLAFDIVIGGGIHALALSLAYPVENISESLAYVEPAEAEPVVEAPSVQVQAPEAEISG